MSATVSLAHWLESAAAQHMCTPFNNSRNDHACGTTRTYKHAAMLRMAAGACQLPKSHLCRQEYRMFSMPAHHMTDCACSRDLGRVLHVQQTRPAEDSPLTKLTFAFLRRLARDPSALGPTPEEIKSVAQDATEQSGTSEQQSTNSQGPVPQRSWHLKAETLCALWELCRKHTSSYCYPDS